MPSISPSLRYKDAPRAIQFLVEAFGFTAPAWYKAIAQGRLCAQVVRSHYDWAAIQRYYNEGHTYRQCREHFGFAAQAWASASPHAVPGTAGNGTGGRAPSSFGR